MYFMEINRGDVFYICRTNNYGVEHNSGRPAVIVSSNRHNHTSQIVEVVYLTTQRQDRDFPENIPCSATNADAVILCNQITTVDKDRISNYITTLTPSEMAQVESGLLYSLGMEKYISEDMMDATEAVYEEPETSEEEDDFDAEYEALLKEVESLRTTKTVLATERNVYKSLYEDLLKKVVK